MEIKGIEVVEVSASSIDELLDLLPVQTEILRLERALVHQKRIPLLPLDQIEAQLPPAYVQAMKEIPALTSCFNPVELITIDDVAKVKQEFLEKAARGELENPSFTYLASTSALRATLQKRGLTVDGVEERLRGIRSELAKEAPDELAAIYRTALLSKIDDDLATIELYRGLVERDDLRVKCAFATKYGSGVDDALFEAARLVFGYLVATRAHTKQDLDDRGPKMTSEELAGAVRWMLERYYEHYQVKTGRPIPEEAKFRVMVDPSYSSIDVRDKSAEGPTIGIPPKERSVRQSLGLLRHEVDQHVRQSLNGQLMFGFGGGGMKVDEETWYEGLAKHREVEFLRQRFGDESSPTLPYSTFAIRMADEGKSFVEVFEAIKEMRMLAGNSETTAAANAWIAAYRVIRGHSDTSNKRKFGLPKDQAYLRGWMLAAQLDRRGLLHLSEAAVSKLNGLPLIARFDFGPGDLLFPDLNLAARYLEEEMKS